MMPGADGEQRQTPRADLLGRGSKMEHEVRLLRDEVAGMRTDLARSGRVADQLLDQHAQLVQALRRMAWDLYGRAADPTILTM